MWTRGLECRESPEIDFIAELKFDNTSPFCCVVIISAIFTFQTNERENWSASMLRALVVTPHQVEDAEQPEDDHEEDDGEWCHLWGSIAQYI